MALLLTLAGLKASCLGVIVPVTSPTVSIGGSPLVLEGTLVDFMPVVATTTHITVTVGDNELNVLTTDDLFIPHPFPSAATCPACVPHLGGGLISDNIIVSTS